eukprot:TRINITY_DN1531_c1_g1_i1.p1 TRINITY_DN1531_c1_g1~~TRINITY_DN1531_c1_g1_i1.p1  ORF type:complete len:111 (+),score=7.23 TRINITY_DN1531_c1_g1_i1:35-334(+)
MIVSPLPHAAAAAVAAGWWQGGRGREWYGLYEELCIYNTLTRRTTVFPFYHPSPWSPLWGGFLSFSVSLSCCGALFREGGKGEERMKEGGNERQTKKKE